MQRLTSKQQQVLKKMKSSNHMAAQLDSFYLVEEQMHNFRRIFAYRNIAFYLQEPERKEIVDYYYEKFVNEEDEEKKLDYQTFYKYAKKYNQYIKSYKYDEEEIEWKECFQLQYQQSYSPRYTNISQLNNDMERLTPQQQQVLKKMKTSNDMAAQLDSFYHIEGQMHNLRRMFGYRNIAYYLQESQRQEIVNYYQKKSVLESDKKKKMHYQDFYKFVKSYNAQIKELEYTQYGMKWRKEFQMKLQNLKSLQDKAKSEQMRAEDTLQSKLRSLWDYIFKRCKKVVLTEPNDEEKKLY